MNYRSPELRRALAGDYVIGLMAPAARRRFERLLADDPALREEVARWQRTLAGLGESLPQVPVPNHVWRAIVARIEPPQLRVPTPRPARRRWQLAALAASLALALGLGLALMPESPRYGATLAATDAAPALQVRAYRDHLRLEPLQLAGMANDRSLELWAIAADGVPVSLGLVPTLGHSDVPLNARQRALLGGSVTLAVSLEPKGGSPSGKPTGAILYTGVLAGL